MTNNKLSIGITGASGLVGKNLVNYFSEKGWNVFGLQRNPEKSVQQHVTFHYFCLPFDINEEIISKCDVIIHCAVQYYNSKNKDSDDINISGTKNLYSLCKKHNVKFIFLSTMSAHDKAESHYGKHKYLIEKMLDSKNDLILRLGLVMAEGGLFTSIKEVIKRSAFIPLIDNGAQPVQTIFIEDLCKIIETAIINNTAGVYNIAESHTHTMKSMYQAIVNQLNLKRIFIPVPYFFIYSLLFIVEVLKINLSISIENLKGLKQMRTFSTEKDVEKFGIQLLNMDESIDMLCNRD